MKLKKLSLKDAIDNKYTEEKRKKYSVYNISNTYRISSDQCMAIIDVLTDRLNDIDARISRLEKKGK